MSQKELAEKIRKYNLLLDLAFKEIEKAVVGQKKIVRQFIKAIIANGHVLVEGVPGTAKTLIVKTLAQISSCGFSRIQFTPDLLPTDITGITTYDEKKGFYVVKGPVFSNIILADEINRAPPKVQSALLEAMQEKQVTIGKETFHLPNPFFVLATQNPIEQQGTYELPEAQIDRFLFKLLIGYPSINEEQKILKNNMTINKFENFDINPVLSPEQILEMQADVKKIFLDKKVEKYIVRLIDATRNPQRYDIEKGKAISFGASPRASIAMFIASKAEAMLNNRTFVTPYDVKNVAPDVLRHRLLLNYEALAEGITTDEIIIQILSKVPMY